jgi:hypothetical protein
MIRKFIFWIGLLSVSQLTLGQGFEHTIELGPIAGTSFYLGDANQKLFRNCEPLFGGLVRYPLDKRTALKGSLMVSGIKGYSDTYQVAFDHRWLYFNVQGEFNFFPYEISEYNIESSVATPYILGGIGLIACSKQQQNQTLTSDPLSPAKVVVLHCGVGGKFKLGSRLDLNIEWTINKALTDKLEGVSELNNPYQLNQKMLFNNDFFSTFTIAVTFAIYTKKCPCRSGLPNGY